jgi:hypothetical protein
MRLRILASLLALAACGAPPDDGGEPGSAGAPAPAEASRGTARDTAPGDPRIDAVNRALEQARQDADARHRDVPDALREP